MIRLHSVAGDGVLARAGELILLCSAQSDSGGDPGADTVVDEVLRAHAEVALAGGDGTALADRLDQVAGNRGLSIVAFAPSRGSLVVTVFGHAWAVVTTEHGEQRLALRNASDGVRSMLPGSVLAIRAGLGQLDLEAPVQRWSDLAAGVVRAGGLLLAVADELPAAAVPAVDQPGPSIGAPLPAAAAPADRAPGDRASAGLASVGPEAVRRGPPPAEPPLAPPRTVPPAGRPTPRPSPSAVPDPAAAAVAAAAAMAAAAPPAEPPVAPPPAEPPPAEPPPAEPPPAEPQSAEPPPADSSAASASPSFAAPPAEGPPPVAEPPPAEPPAAGPPPAEPPPAEPPPAEPPPAEPPPAEPPLAEPPLAEPPAAEPPAATPPPVFEKPEPAASEPPAPEPPPSEPAAPRSAGPLTSGGPPQMPPVAAPEANIDRSQPFSSVELFAPDLPAEVRSPLPIATVPDEPDAPVPAHAAADEAVQIIGVYCKNGHFDDPAARYCAVCGISMAQQTLLPRPGPRPPLGVLVLDDGSIFSLDTDYVVGRDPSRDPDVEAGSARPLRIEDPEGLLSRVHVRIHLDGWQVEVVDLGSANGTGIWGPHDTVWQRAPVRQAVTMRPGTQIGLGRRQMRYESHRNT